jgi:hypothetical protein
MLLNTEVVEKVIMCKLSAGVVALLLLTQIANSEEFHD